MNLTERDIELLELLENEVRHLTLEQIIKEFWSTNRDPRRDAMRRLKKLPVELTNAVDHPVLPMATPVFTWHPGDAKPNADKIAYQLAKRWSMPPTRHTFVTLTSSRPVRACERIHDASVSSVYLLHFRHNRKQKWVLEDKLSEWTVGKRPDAVVYQQGEPPIVIECGGKYPASKLKSIHAEYSERRMHYQIW